MNIVTNISELKQVHLAGKNLLRFTFHGILNQKTARSLCDQWKSFCLQQPDRKFIIVFNALCMENYEPQARIAFQQCMKELNKQIDKIWVVTESKIVLGGASIMSLIVGLPIKAVRSEEQISF